MKLIKIVLLFALANLSFSQQKYHEEWYSADTGDLPQNSIKSITPDKYGFIWITTEDGLLRYDGRNFKVYNSSNPEISTNRFAYLSGSIKNDSLTTHTAYYADEILINKRTISKINTKNNQITSEEKEIYENLLYYTNNLNNGKSDFKKSQIRRENGDYFLIGTNKIILYNKKNKIVEEIHYNYQENTIYFLFNNELILLNYKNDNYTYFRNGVSVTTNFNIPKNSKIIYNHLVQQLFVYTENDISLLVKTNNVFNLKKVFSKKNLNLNIKSLYFDTKNNKLFIGTIDKGLCITTPYRFKALIDPSNSNNNYYANFPLSENEFVTAKGEIFNAKGLVRRLKINANNYYSITVDKQKNIWIPNDNNIIKFLKATNYETSQTYNFDYSVGTMYTDSYNKIWIGLNRDLKNIVKVYTIDANQTNSKPILLENIPEKINFFLENSKHELFMASDNKLLIYNPKNKQIHSIFSGKANIRSIFIDKDSLVWICTYNNGFGLFKNNTFYKMPYDNNKYLATAHCIKEDKKGHFWISTNKGLIEVDKQNLLNYHKNKTPVYYHHYYMKDGFLTNEFNGGCQPCAIEINNQFIFPSLNGIVLFNPATIKTNQHSKEFYINEVELDEKILYFKDTLRISRDIDRVKFKIDYAYFGNIDNINFEAKLLTKGNGKWVNLKNESEVSFTNLSAGCHTLYVRKIIPFSSNYQIKKIIIKIPFIFYEKLWFKILILLILTLIIIAAIKLRYRQIRIKNITLEKIIKKRTADLFDSETKLKATKKTLNQEILQQKKLIGTISHDIKSPLKFLSITAKHLHEKSLLSENENIKKNAKIMQDSASELYRFVENLVDYSKVFIDNNDIEKLKKEDVDIVINQKINLFKNIASGNNTIVTYKNFAPNKIEINEKILGIIIHNLLDNAIKNTHSGEIIIEANVINNKNYISIEDTGIGMEKETVAYYMNIQKNHETDKLILQNFGLGLHMVLELLRLLKGELHIASEINERTKVTIIF